MNSENLSLYQLADNENPNFDYEELYIAIDSLENKEKSLVNLFYLGEKSIKEIQNKVFSKGFKPTLFIKIS